MAESCNGLSRRSVEHLKAAFLAMEPPSCFVSLARQIGGGSITTEVQRYILEHCINNGSNFACMLLFLARLSSFCHVMEDCIPSWSPQFCHWFEVAEGISHNNTYIKNILKKVIVAAESTCEDILDGLYENFSYHMALHTEDDMLREKNKIYKQISFLFPSGYVHIKSDLTDLVVPLQCSLNMLEGDTGCTLWPSSLFLSEIILTFPDTFANKTCFEVGSGVGLVGISLIHVGASKVVLSDGDESSLENMKYNLELNQLSSETKMSQKTYVECKHLQWESPSESKLLNYRPDIVLGADIIYDPQCLPYLIQVLSILLSANLNGRAFPHHGENQSNITLHSDDEKEVPTAYIAQVIRNYETFHYFLKLANEANLCVVDITETKRPQNLLPYMLSYDQSSVRLFRVSSTRNCIV